MAVGAEGCRQRRRFENGRGESSGVKGEAPTDNSVPTACGCNCGPGSRAGRLADFWNVSGGVKGAAGGCQHGPRRPADVTQPSNRSTSSLASHHTPCNASLPCRHAGGCFSVAGRWRETVPIHTSATFVRPYKAVRPQGCEASMALGVWGCSHPWFLITSLRCWWLSISLPI